MPGQGMRLGGEGLDLERLGRRDAARRRRSAPRTRCDDRRLQPRVQPDDLARLDEQAGLLERLADRRLVDGLVDLEEAAGLRPPAEARLDAASDQDDLAGVGDRDRRHDEPRVDVGDVPAAAQQSRWRSSPSIGPKRSVDPQREQ